MIRSSFSTSKIIIETHYNADMIIYEKFKNKKIFIIQQISSIRNYLNNYN